MSELSERLRGAASLTQALPACREAAARIEKLETALEAMCLNMKNDGHAYRDCYKRARVALAPEQDK